MQARELIDNASFGPETLKVVFHAFDLAWEVVEQRFTPSGAAREAARVRLAELVLSFAHEGSCDPQPIADAAAQAFAAPMEFGHAGAPEVAKTRC